MTLNEVSKFDDFFEFGKTLKEGSGSLMERAMQGKKLPSACDQPAANEIRTEGTW